MELTMAAVRAGRRATMNDGSGWTRCARGLANGAITAAVVAAGMTMTNGSTAAAASVPEHVIVRGAAGCTASVAATIARLGGTVSRPLGILNGATAVIGSNELSALRSAPCVTAVTPNGSVSLNSFGGYDPTASVGSVYNTTQEIGAQNYWQAGYTGKGIGVALIDSGVSPVVGLNGTGKLVSGPDISFDSQSPTLQTLDGFGHGTHMAGIIAGNDGTLPPPQYAGNTGQFVGVAPDAHVVNVKVADAHGAVDVSQVIAGIDWTVQHAQDSKLNIRVINLSFGTDSSQSYLLDPLAYAAEQAYLHGIVVVVAAGNGGNSTTSLTDPAMDPFVIAVGAANTNGTTKTSDDTVASFSNRGSSSRAPDLVAPGVHIEGLRDPGSYIDTQYGSTATVAQRFFLGSGTSQATAVVSGAAALLISQHPDWTPDQVRYALDSSAMPLAGQDYTLQGAGEINLTPNLSSSVSASTTLTLAPTTTTTSTSLTATSSSFALSASMSTSFRPSQSSGTGTLEGSRGSIHLVNNGVALTGEQDIFGKAWSSASMATAERNASAWNGGTFNGSTWTGSTWTGSTWTGSTWTNSSWSGSTWTGSTWTGNTWTGSTWTGSTWTGSTWTGSTWTGSTWTGSTWTGSTWTSLTWS
ncbi:MAG: hypothetical protein NVS3B18_11670 [Candidatus Dormibacteria bacterium]